MPYRGTTVKALLSWLCWSDFNLAYQSPFRHSQQHQYNLPNILWRYLPFRHPCRSATKFCIDASRHNVSDPHVVVAMVQHHGLRETVQSELGSVVRRAARKCILPCQATYIDDVAAATILYPRQRFARAIKRSRQIRLDGLLPIFHCEFRCAFHDAQARIVHQNIETSRFTFHPLKQCCNVCACSYIGNFSHHFTFATRSSGRLTASSTLVLAASAYRHRGARVRQCTARSQNQCRVLLQSQPLSCLSENFRSCIPSYRPLGSCRGWVRARAYYPQTRPRMAVNWVYAFTPSPAGRPSVSPCAAPRTSFSTIRRVFDDPLAVAIARRARAGDRCSSSLTRDHCARSSPCAAAMRRISSRGSRTRRSPIRRARRGTRHVRLSESFSSLRTACLRSGSSRDAGVEARTAARGRHRRSRRHDVRCRGLRAAVARRRLATGWLRETTAGVLLLARRHAVSFTSRLRCHHPFHCGMPSGAAWYSITPWNDRCSSPLQQLALDALAARVARAGEPFQLFFDPAQLDGDLARCGLRIDRGPGLRRRSTRAISPDVPMVWRSRAAALIRV